MCKLCTNNARAELATDPIRDLYIEAAKRVHDGATPDQLDPKLMDALVAALMQAVNDNFIVEDLEAETAQVLLNMLRENVFIFSGAKTYQELRQFSALLLNEAGEIVPFSEFLTEARKLSDVFTAHLQAEYNHAVASSQMAAKWQRITQEKEASPMLRYNTALDERVRPTHAALEGITLPVDHDFWKTNYPPNGWNCRCDVDQIQDLNEPASNVPAVNTTPLDPLFSNNVGIDGIIYPDRHPYIENLPAEVLTKIKTRKP
jgi:SPP1 gp7 family putative phage head morphogenesis protein